MFCTTTNTTIAFDVWVLVAYECREHSTGHMPQCRGRSTCPKCRELQATRPRPISSRPMKKKIKTEPRRHHLFPPFNPMDRTTHQLTASRSWAGPVRFYVFRALCNPDGRCRGPALQRRPRRSQARIFRRLWRQRPGWEPRSLDSEKGGAAPSCLPSRAKAVPSGITMAVPVWRVPR